MYTGTAIAGITWILKCSYKLPSSPVKKGLPCWKFGWEVSKK
jgi:hypothetical protein